MGAITSTLGLRQADIAFIFHVSVDGLPILGGFMSVEATGRTHEPFIYREGGRSQGPHVLYGPPAASELVLRWGLMDRTALYDWIQQVEVGVLFKKSGAIYQFPRLMASPPLRIYSFTGAWPLAWKGPRLDAMNSEVPVEELRISVDHLTMEALPC